MERIGKHRLLCGDLVHGAVERVMEGEQADVVYCDPPWGIGRLKAFAGEIEFDYTWEQFVESLCQACLQCSTPKAHIFIEMGCRWEQDVTACMNQYNTPLQARWTLTYGNPPRPNALLLFRGSGEPFDLATSSTHGNQALRAIFKKLVAPGTIVLDPCTGLGATARETHRQQGYFRGVELVPSRLERTKAWLEKRQP